MSEENKADSVKTTTIRPYYVELIYIPKYLLGHKQQQKYDIFNFHSIFKNGYIPAGTR